MVDRDEKQRKDSVRVVKRARVGSFRKRTAAARDGINLVDPTSAVVGIAVKYGVKALVQSLDGNDQVGSAASEILAALVAGESRMGQRLSAIEDALREIREDRYKVELAAGSSFLSDAMTSPPNARSDDLQRAREHLTRAVAAARSDLQRAHAERQALLAQLMLGRMDLAAGTVHRLEAAAMRAALQAFGLPYSHDATIALMRSEGLSETGRGKYDRTREAALRVAHNAAEAKLMCGILLAEAAVIANQIGLVERSVQMAPISQDPHRRRWHVHVPAGRPLRFGPITAQFKYAFNSSGRRPSLGIADFTDSPRPAALDLAFEPAFRTRLWTKSGGEETEIDPSTPTTAAIEASAGATSVMLGIKVFRNAATAPTGESVLDGITFYPDIRSVLHLDPPLQAQR